MNLTPGQYKAFSWTFMAAYAALGLACAIVFLLWRQLDELVLSSLFACLFMYQLNAQRDWFVIRLLTAALAATHQESRERLCDEGDADGW